MLTEKECKQALKDLTFHAFRQLGSCTKFDYEKRKFVLKKREQRQHDILLKLINEYFYNQSLRFEEIKKGMWIWDNVSKEWMKVEITRETYTKFIECWTIGWHLLKKIEYKENRFYRKEVHDV